MRKLIATLLLCWVCLVFNSLVAQQLVEYEYWIDNENRISVPIISTPTQFNLADSIDVSSLTEGAHTIYYRYKDNNEVWSSVISYFFIKDKNDLIPASQLNKVEYWINENSTSRTKLTVAETTTFNLLDSIDASTLFDGVHTIHCRFASKTGQYSSVLSSFFIKDKNDLIPASQLNKVEYWLNGNSTLRTKLTIAETTNFNLLDSIDASTLFDGVHTIHCRFASKNGQYSSVLSSFFIKDKNDLIPASQLNKVEYWLNENSTSRTKLTIAETTNFNLLDSINTNSLTDGAHILYYRFASKNGQWSSVLSSFFIKDKSDLIASPYLNTIEYWVDSASTKITQLLTGDVSLHQFLDSIDISGLTNGMHNLYLRYKDDTGRWSAVLHSPFTKDGIWDENNMIIGYRYWIDLDPTIINYVQLSTPQKQLALVTDIDLSNVPQGDHIFHMQFMDSRNLWSHATNDSIHQDSIPKFEIDTDTKQLCDSGQVAIATNYSPYVDKVEINYGDGTAINDSLTHWYDAEGSHTITAVIWYKGMSDSIVYTASEPIIVNPIYKIITDSIIQSGDSVSIGTYTFKNSGQYSIPFQTVAGCDSIIIINLTITTGLNKDSKLIGNIQLYPNPVKDELILESDKIQIEKIRILDLNGREVLLTENKLLLQKQSINLSQLIKGNYIVQLKTDSGIISKKIIKH